MRKILTIAGSDSSGGAGIQTDLKTFSACRTYGMSVITAITAQNTMGVTCVENVSPSMVSSQMSAVFSDIEVDAVKIGMLSESSIIDSVYEGLTKYGAKNIVLDPIMISTSGYDLIDQMAKSAMIEKLFKIADLVTPNIHEAIAIASILEPDEDYSIKNTDDMVYVGRKILNHTNKAVLIKGGHLEDDACDLLLYGDNLIYYKNKRIDTKNTHGTGCTLSSAIAAYLGLGYQLKEAVSLAKDFITKAIEHSLDIGRGAGPTNPMGDIYDKLDMIKGD